ncbi:chemotaxis protein CheD [Carboxydocella sp. ULO1]|uniref:chemotaxis protein CheD n=1 Tax=Carboxydocella sp. ULO1 TaxID=1926599 RepID=UPI0009AE2BFD|nr:chemotaxis protein CheD [Carboxydocella sp. ULO1]AVX31164.1 chemotaxis protein CheD [Carboxydocella thermautotrophica]GAW28274.1 chemotaxis protein CheD [Carboxydocella sp. ULO1]
MEIIKVGMADLKIGQAPARLLTSGLGSCVGICLWDFLSKKGGMAHIMLPDSTKARVVGNPAKFADTAVPALIQLLENHGACRRRLKAKIAGGAQMFSFGGEHEIMKVGQRNVEAVKTALAAWDIPLLAEDTGGNIGRTIEFDLETGLVHIRTMAAKNYHI